MPKIQNLIQNLRKSVLTNGLQRNVTERKENVIKIKFKRSVQRLVESAKYI